MKPPDFTKFQNGASVLDNYLIVPQGGIYRRYGTRYVRPARNNSRTVRLIPVKVGDETVIVELSGLRVCDATIRVHTVEEK